MAEAVISQTLPYMPEHPRLEQFYRTVIHSITRFIYRPRYIGFENIPETGPAIIVCNHVSYVDGPLIDAGCKRIVRYIIDEEIYNVPVVHYFMKMDRAIPIMPNRKSIDAAMDMVSEGLKAGDVICIFPEGQLTYTGGLSRFRPGVEWMLKRDPVPVIPMVITGLWGSSLSRKHLGSWRRLLPARLRGRITIACGKPIPANEVNINQLQDVILKLKYSISSENF